MATLTKQFVLLGAATLVGAALANIVPDNHREVSAAGVYTDDINAAAAVTTEGDKVTEAVFSPAGP